MANHVDSYLSFVKISPEGVAKLKEIFDRFDRFQENGECHLAYAFYDSLEALPCPTYELIGAKWGFVQDYDESGMSMYSAWSAVPEFVEHIISEIATVDKSVVATYTYSDEMPNFIGVQLYTADGLDDEEYMDDEEIRMAMMSSNPELSKLWDEDEEEFTDDGDMFNELIWEFVGDWHCNESEFMLKSLEVEEELEEV